MRRALLLPLLLAAAAGAAGASPPANVVAVGCDQIVGTVAAGNAGGYRVVGGDVSAPPAFLPGVVHLKGGGSFPYWRKAGMVIRAGKGPVTVTVPAAWRDRVRVGWGNPARPATAVRFAACPSSRGWNAYAGGFFLRTRSACVPLTVAAGGRRSTVRFGVGRRC